MTTRKYSSRSQQTTLTAALTSSGTSATVVSGTALLGGVTISAGETFTVVIDPDTALEEIVDVTAVSTNTLTLTRGVDGSTGQAHSAGAVVRHMAIGRDYRESNQHIENTTTAHGITLSQLVKTTDTGTVSSGMLATGAVGTVKIDDTAVTTAKINNSAVTADKIATDAVTTAKIQDSAVTSAKIANDTIVNADINSAAAIAATKIAGTAVTQADTGTVTSTMIANGTIVDADINSSAAIDKTKISGTAITAADSGTVTSTMIADGTIVNADINASAGIAYGKLSLGGTITSADLVDGTIVNSDINASAGIALSKLATDPLARANHTGTQAASTISDFDTQVRTSRLDQMAAPTAAVSANSQKITNLANPVDNGDAVSLGYLASQKGVANGIAELDGSGLVPTHHLPALAITTTQVVNSQANMLALTAQVGDVAVRTDVNKSFILTATPASTLGNWQELLSPTDAVLSVDGSTGAINLSGTYLNKTTGQLLGNLDANTNKVTNLGTPTSNNDAATKVYVDTVAGSATAAAASAAAAATTYDNFDDRYLGSKSTAPSVDNDGDALLEGAIYWNSVDNAMYAWTGSEWGSISSTAAIYRYRFNASGGETSVTGTDANGLTLSYIPGKAQVYLNGVLLVPTTDYTATNGTSITSLAALASGDVLEVITFTSFELASAIEETIFDAKGDLLVGTAADTVGKLTVGTNGQYLQADSSTATGLTWSTVSGYSAPTLGSTSIASGATVTTIAGLTLTSPTVNDPKINLAFDAETASYTAVLANNGQVVTMDNASANTFSIPTNASVAFPVGTQINVLQIGAGQTTIQAVTSGTTTVLSTGGTAAAPKLRARYSMATCIKSATDTWYVIGDIS
jgi:hypothetical protein